MRFDQWKRRDFITLLGGAAATWPLAARAQQPKRIGLLMNGVPTDALNQANATAFAQQMRRLGWIEGQNLHSEIRWNEGNAALVRTYATELAGLGLDVILASSSSNLIALQRLSPTAPIVFIQVSDPVTQGFVTSMAHPRGNITGFAYYEFTIGGKWVDLLKQMVPAIERIGVIFNPETNPQAKFFMDSIEAAAPVFGVKVVAMPIRGVAELEPLLAGFSGQPNCGLIFPTGTFPDRKGIVEIVVRHRLPAIFSTSTWVQYGGLMRYGPELDDQFRQAGVYVDRLLKGAKAGDLPVQTPTKYSLAINLKTAKALGIEVPVGLLLIADEQIE